MKTKEAKQAMVTGLSSAEAGRRLKKYGPNIITSKKKVSALKIFFSQFTSPIILLLIGAAAVSFFTGVLPEQESNIFDALLIFFIVLLAGISGFVQEFKAEKAVETLKKMSTPVCRVVRDGKEHKISASEVVPGDAVIIDEGDIIPADARLLKAYNLEVDESSLTGESVAVSKDKGEMVFMNAFANSGSGIAEVTKTGMKTKIGQIAGELQAIRREKNPFQAEISKLSKRVIIVVLVIIVLIFSLSFAQYGLYSSLLLAVSLAVAAIPEGLPAVVTLTLAMSARTMAKKNALVRKLNVTESLGSVNVICTDKTGTLTKNEMTVRQFYFNNKIYSLEEGSRETLNLLMECGAICNDSSVGEDEEGHPIFLGDQTEIAISKAAKHYGIGKDDLTDQGDVIDKVPFKSERKRMSVVVKKEKSYTVYSKGAPEVLIDYCKYLYEDEEIVPLGREKKEAILGVNRDFASGAMRVLGFAFKKMDERPDNEKEIESELVWLGLQAMIDPPRDEAKEAVTQCKTAGIRIVMITGDNSDTAKAIAKEVGIDSSGEVIDGKMLDRMEGEALREALAETNIFARTTPFHKQKILKVLKEKDIVVMTGDGVNDALALKNADVGVAMGIKGTEVARETSDMILLDDNFATIVSAIRQGRTIFENIRKFINYLFTCNFAEVAVLLFATLFFSLDKPVLLPVHILWINLLTDGFPALALGADPPRANIMNEPPRKKGEPIMNRNLMYTVGTVGLIMSITLLGAFLYVWNGKGLEKAVSVLFTGFVLFEFVRIATIRFQEKAGFFNNKWLIWALLISLLLQLGIVYSPLNEFFHVVPLGLNDWFVLIISMLIYFVLSIGALKLIGGLTDHKSN